MGTEGIERLRILVVDDELGMRRAVCRALEKFSVRLPDIDGEVGFEIDQAVSGEEALEKMETAFRIFSFWIINFRDSQGWTCFKALLRQATICSRL